MNSRRRLALGLTWFVLASLRAGEAPPKVPRFSIEHMDRSVDPGTDFYRFAAGHWLANNPVPADKSRWSGFDELRERNWHLLRDLLESAAAEAHGAPGSPRRQVGELFVSAMDTNRIEKLRFKPIARDLRRIARLQDTQALFALLADFHQRDLGGIFNAEVSPDAKHSSIYAFELGQGGLGLPDRDYYLKDDFAKTRQAYLAHVARMFTLLGEKPAAATAHAATVLELETALAKASRTRVELRDPSKNYNKFATAELCGR